MLKYFVIGTFLLMFLGSVVAPAILDEEIQICNKAEKDTGESFDALAQANCLSLATYVTQGDGECVKYIGRHSSSGGEVLSGALLCLKLEEIRTDIKQVR